MKKLVMVLLFIIIALTVWGVDEVLRKYYPSGDKVVEHTYYSVCYDGKMKNPKWVMYRLTAKNVLGDKNDTVTRKGMDFVPDPMIKESVKSKVYSASGYDRGHMCPADDMDFDRQAMIETFYTSNIVPQDQKLNRGEWAQLEKWVKKQINNNKDLLIITGPIYKAQYPKRLNDTGPVVPDALFKIVFDPKSRKIASFIFPNSIAGTGKPVKSFEVSLKTVKETIGADFFSNEPDEEFFVGSVGQFTRNMPKMMKFEPATP